MKVNCFLDFLSNKIEGTLHVLDESIPWSKYFPIDLSKTNKVLSNVGVSSLDKLGAYINNEVKRNKATVAYGGYLEKRNIYKRSKHFNEQKRDERNIHLGIDLWCDEETPIHTPLDAIVHSFKNNNNFGDYGPTIILEHNIDGVIFYTLYGHLSLKSIENLKEGQVFKQGVQIATLGDETVNGDYPPHLHFQIIKDLQGLKGDYPGVCSKEDLEFYAKNCPDPNLLLKL